MLVRIETHLRRIRRHLSRSHWLTRLLGLPVSKGPPTRPGLVMIQIDGLSQTRLRRALDKGELPFLKRLIEQEHYRLHTQYAGLPAATPAAQAELFYGVRTAVPAFSFRDHETGQIVRMFEPEAATRVEARLRREGQTPLLKDGSVYADNFTGGAETQEAHFCPAALGWGPVLRSAKPLALLFFLLSNLYSFLRIGVLLGLELLLASVDFVRGLSRGRDFVKELKFIPTRVAISILMRELCVIGGKIDLHRGLPIIHINFLGYDEQAHRRGPDSLFAHWTLKGIDDAIARLWRAAHRAPWRHYELWVYSDHGQHAALPYVKLQGDSIESAVTKAFAALQITAVPRAPGQPDSIQYQRVRLLGGKRFQRLFHVPAGDSGSPAGDEPQVAALGPVGFVYPPRELGPDERERLARELVHRHSVPVALTLAAPGRVLAWTRDGQYRLPEQTAELFGRDHPFLNDLGSDLINLCAHRDAGEVILLGWHAGARPVTFAVENGSHAGLTPEETEAFCLLPQDAPLPSSGKPYLRHADLRQAAFDQLGGRRCGPAQSPRRDPDQAGRRLRIMTYNVHSCVGTDGKLDPGRIARVIALHAPDVVALQELDVGRPRTGGEDQAERIAHQLAMEFHFHPALHLEEERYGDAILTPHPVRLVKAAALPGPGPRSRCEPRGALWVSVQIDGLWINVINTHLGLRAGERLIQADALLSEEWLGHPACRGPTILCGDFNAMPASKVCRRLRERLEDAQRQLAGHIPRSTFPSRFPLARIDHLLVDTPIRVTDIRIPRSRLTRVASDHLPLIVDIEIGPPADTAAQNEA